MEHPFKKRRQTVEEKKKKEFHDEQILHLEGVTGNRVVEHNHDVVLKQRLP